MKLESRTNITLDALWTMNLSAEEEKKKKEKNPS